MELLIFLHSFSMVRIQRKSPPPLFSPHRYKSEATTHFCPPMSSIELSYAKTPVSPGNERQKPSIGNDDDNNSSRSLTSWTLSVESEKFGQIVTSLIRKLFGECDPAAPRKSLPLHTFVYKTIQAVKLPEEVHFLAVYFITQVRVRNPSVRMKPGMEYVLVIACMILAQKTLDDYRWPNKVWARITGLSLRDLNVMEMELLDRLSYDLNVSGDDYKSWVAVLNSIALKDIERRRRMQEAEEEREKRASSEIAELTSRGRKRLSQVCEPDDDEWSSGRVAQEGSPRKLSRRNIAVLRSQMITPPMSP